MTPELVADHGLSPDEYERILEAMGREPTFTELGVFSAMWSEHCGYKNSRPLLRQLPTEAPWVIQGPGENAGVIDVGDGWAIAFKIESHNHPSAVEPYQGAATGVGGILRDIFTMGARPIAVLDSLRFGDLDDGRVRYLFGGVVKGVGDYGNCVGIPNLGGEVYFDRGYEGNPLVNAMAIGLLRADEMIKGEAKGVGNTIMTVGARTGRDGIHGATFASEELSQENEAKRPQVQVGDPFTEKLLLEASLELIHSGAITGIQDMGAAGLTSSASEMAGRSGNGVEIDVALVPVRERGMTPYEILLSESQERMLVVAEKGREDEVRRILEKWELEAAVIGTVTDDGMFRVLENGAVVADIPAEPLTGACPTYTRVGTEAPDIRQLRERDLSEFALPRGDLTDRLRRLIRSPNIASKRWVFRQYDTTVRASSVVWPGGDAGVVRIPGTRRGLAAKTDCNGRYCYLHPRRGAAIAVAEAARNLACVGALPRAVTNNLNFGSPLKPAVYYQLREAVAGMAEACLAFETPVTGGNVSLYNETEGAPIYPTPVIGMVGVVEDVERVCRHAFTTEGDHILLLGTNRDELGGSEYLYVLHDLVAGDPPQVDLMAERQLQHALLAMIGARLLSSAHDCAEGGIACALAESAIGDGLRPMGVEVTLRDDLAPVPLLFGETQGRVVVSCPAGSLATVARIAHDQDVPCAEIGRVGGVGGGFHIRAGTSSLQCGVGELADAFFGAIPALMDAPAASPPAPQAP
ncbi:MAG: phosphoribosylformylglycinamidine synthase subunit PurL [Gemmatimonadetes bacterium]|nr:phosphoribosylformylglycinamidine synthase subunit PurL [Gemmatimonadota bacterium]